MLFTFFAVSCVAVLLHGYRSGSTASTQAAHWPSGSKVVGGVDRSRFLIMFEYVLCACAASKHIMHIVFCCSMPHSLTRHHHWQSHAPDFLCWSWTVCAL